jgi:hypothetical protein
VSIRDNIRTKEEIFESDHVTIGELFILFNNSKEQLYREQYSFKFGDHHEEDRIKSRFELLDI